MVREIGRVAGVLGSIGTATACVVLARSWLRMNEGPALISFVVLIILLALAVFCGLAAWRKNALWILISSGIAFVPVGFYLLLTPGLGRWVGLWQLLQVASGILLKLGRPSRRASSA